MRYFIQTFGCQMNYSDSERLATVLENLGYQKTSRLKSADAIFFNTCSIKQTAEDRVFGQMVNLRELKKTNPNLIIGLTGCMVRSSSTQQSKKPDKLITQVSGLDLVVRIEELAKLPDLLQECGVKVSPDENIDNSTLANYFKINPKYASQFQAFLPIMSGCDNFCAFCIVPFSRGRERSRSIDEILFEAKNLVANGCVEITLLGQNVNSYGKSRLAKASGLFNNLNKDPFIILLEELNKLDGLKRLRFTSPHPKDMTDEVISAITTLPKMCPYIHLPIQSGDNEVLRRMNRGYTREHYQNIIKKIRDCLPNAAISTDIIVGFPGETAEQFENTYKLFEEVEWDMSYHSQYSPRRSTLSHRLFTNDVPKSEKARRWHRINDLLRQISLKKHQAYLGKTVEVLVERSKSGQMASGRTDTFKIVNFTGGKDLVGQFVKVKITKTREWIMEGELVGVQQKKPARSLNPSINLKSLPVLA